MPSASFEAKLIPQRTTWDVVRLSGAPLLVALLLMGASEALERVAPTAASVLGTLAMVGLMGGSIFMVLAWQRGLTIAVADGVLTVGTKRRAPLSEMGTRVGEMVMEWRAGYSRGITWSPLLTLCFADRSELRIACQGVGGPAEGRTPTALPNYYLPKAQWDELVALLGAPNSVA